MIQENPKHLPEVSSKRNSSIAKALRVREYLLNGVIINHPKNFIISRQKNRICRLGLSYPVFQRELKLLVEQGYISLTPGKYFTKNKSRKNPTGSYGCRIKAGRRFDKKKILKEIQFSELSKKWFPNSNEKITHKTFKVKYKTYDPFIGRLNEVNRHHTLSYEDDVLNMEFSRNKANGADLRLYSRHGIQYYNKKQRCLFKIDNQETTEIDISECHLSLMREKLKAKGLTPKVTTFDFHDYRFTRAQIKTGFYISVNAKNKREANFALKKKLKLTPAKSQDLINFIGSYFEEYHEFFFSESWKELQEAEAKLADVIIKNCLKESVPIIPIFDSFIVRKSDISLVCNSISDLGFNYSIWREK